MARQRTKWARVLVGTLAVVAVLGLAACGDDDDDDDAASSDPCDELDALKSSIADLRQVDVVQQGTDALTSAFDTVEQDADALIDAVGDDLSSETDAVKDAIDDLEQAFDQRADNGLAPVGTAAEGVVTAVQALVTEVESNDCS